MESLEELQSHKGSSETAASSNHALRLSPLQSHKGSSETRSRRDSEPCPCCRFNPTRVLLKPDLRAYLPWDTYLLQSHKGSSETGTTTRRGPTYSTLQSHKGSSETTVSRSTSNMMGSCFNPTRVLLKLALVERDVVEAVASIPQGFF